MFSVGIDVSSGKSDVAIISFNGEIIKRFKIKHDNEGYEVLVKEINLLDKESRVILEATGIYHLGIVNTLINANIYVSVVNANMMSRFISTLDYRKVKNDEKDALNIAQYGIEKWKKLKRYEIQDSRYEDLIFLSRQYSQLLSVRTKLKVQYSNLLEVVFPGYNDVFPNNQEDLMLKVIKIYYHPTIILKKGIEEFVKEFEKMSKEKGYRNGEKIASKLYNLAENITPSMSVSKTVETAMNTLVDQLIVSIESTQNIITEMNEIAKTLPEYEIAINMPGVGNVLAPQLIAEVGDIRRFNSHRSLIAYAGIDVPVYQSGKFTARNMHISRKGNSNLRRIGFLIISMINRCGTNQIMNEYLAKKKAEGKHHKVVMIAGLNKFLRIYYARVIEKHS